MMASELRVKVSYTPSLGESICHHLLNGKSVRQIEKLPGMPAARTVYRWLEANAEFRTRYQLARELWAHGVLDEIRDLVDGKIIPWPASKAEQKAWLKRIAIMVQARQWIYHLLAPKKYLFLGGDYGVQPAAYEVVEPPQIG